MEGDADIARVGGLIADPGRARMLLALGDGRALPASVLAAEASVAPSTASAHLSKLVDGGLLVARRSGRHRYFALASPEVGALIERLAELAPAAPVRSLRQGTQANAVRTARTCYDHLAGRLGAALMQALLARGLLTGGDGRFDPAAGDRLSAYGAGHDYRLTARGADELEAFGIDLVALRARRRPLIRYCVDWSEQCHHLSGALGAALAAELFARGWISRARRGRAVHLSQDGRAGLAATFGVALPD